MTIAVDLGRKATKQTNRLQGESIAGKWADRRTLLTYIPHHWGIGILLLHTPWSCIHQLLNKFGWIICPVV